MFPLVTPIPYQDPLPLFAIAAAEQGAIFFDSAEGGRYSFIALKPFQILRSKNGVVDINGQHFFAANPWDVLAVELAKFSLPRLTDLPPFQGGVAGYFAYDLNQHLEKLPRVLDVMDFPDLVLGFYDVVAAFDHVTQTAWIFSSGYPVVDAGRYEYAKMRSAQLQACLVDLVLPPLNEVRCENISANFSAASYTAAVEAAREYIFAGDIFEVNIAQCFQALLPEGLSAFDLYRRLRAINPAPFAAYLHFAEIAIASASPERFLQLQNKQVEARPIKGTRPRGKTSVEDSKLAQELQHSVKDRAENIMIVDLLRNDLSRVCCEHTVKVSQLCGLESFARVHHLVSVVTGELREELNALDLLRATFPGGSITGAPKVRAMEIIAELEQQQRGVYCGSIGYIGFNGDMDCSIAIRTFAIKDRQVSFQAGGAVTMDSDGAEEYAETMIKARALLEALVGWASRCSPQPTF